MATDEDTHDTDNPDLDDLLWIRAQLRATIPDLSPKERISALEAYRKLVGSIAGLKKATNHGGSSAAADALAGIVQDVPSGGTEGEWEDHPDVTRNLYGETPDETEARKEKERLDAFVEDVYGGTDD